MQKKEIFTISQEVFDDFSKQGWYVLSPFSQKVSHVYKYKQLCYLKGCSIFEILMTKIIKKKGNCWGYFSTMLMRVRKQLIARQRCWSWRISSVQSLSLQPISKGYKMIHPGSWVSSKSMLKHVKKVNSKICYTARRFQVIDLEMRGCYPTELSARWDVYHGWLSVFGIFF